jgi:branched-chain amino acid transport system ATP-binding protein/neutral amino acid transport system ATP-binding protein
VREADHVYLVDLGRVRAHGPAREFPLARVRALIQECLLR